MTEIVDSTHVYVQMLNDKNKQIIMDTQALLAGVPARPPPPLCLYTTSLFSRFRVSQVCTNFQFLIRCQSTDWLL